MPRWLMLSLQRIGLPLCFGKGEIFFFIPFQERSSLQKGLVDHTALDWHFSSQFS